MRFSFLLFTFFTFSIYYSQSSGYCTTTVSAPISVDVDNVYSPDVINEVYERVAFRLIQFNKDNNDDCSEAGDEEYRVNLEVKDFNFNNNHEDGLDWAKNGNCFGHDVNSSAAFSVIPTSNYFFYNRTGASITGHMFYWVSMIAGENDGFDDCHLGSGDECLDGWHLGTRKSIPMANYYPGTEVYWGSISGSKFSSYINWGYFLKSTLGGPSNPLDFGMIDENECPSKYHNMSNLSADNGLHRLDIYYEFTIKNHRRLVVDLGFQKGDMTFELYNVNNSGTIGSVISPYSQSSSFPPTYSSTASYNKKYDLNPGNSSKTYIIKVSTPSEGKFKLKIDTDLNPPNNIYYWTGVAQDPFGSTISPPENAWNRYNNWDPCNIPNYGITDPNNYYIDVVIPAPSELHSSAVQPRIYSGNEGKCKSIIINSGAKLTIENNGNLNVKE